MAPEPELARWRNYPEGQLCKLGERLRAGEWSPAPWLQVPFPKKGACLRHMYQPTVEDQVAFMAHAVLIGPLLDSRLKNFVFGSRWYRPIAWDSRNARPQWVLRPYQFHSRQAFLPYGRDHGLYRRVAHWSAARMMHATISKGGYGAQRHRPSDFNPGDLPDWVRKNWWTADSSRSNLGCWATLDLQLAFPSVRRGLLKKSLKCLLDREFQLRELVQGYPRPVLKCLEARDVRSGLADALVEALRKVAPQEDGGIESIPVDAWRPEHVLADIGSVPKGLPTGLAISGLLLNVALACADGAILEYLMTTSGRYRGAFLRFADDLTLLVRSKSGLFKLIDEVSRAISGSAIHLPAESNLYFNLSKANPEPIRNAVHCYLLDCGWTECNPKEKQCRVDCNDGAGCGELVPTDRDRNDESRTVTGLHDWWKTQRHKRLSSRTRGLEESLERAALRAHDVGPFVTFLVERMSKMGRDTLADRFGEGASERLERLHDLAQLDIEDDQVRPDTRRVFAANRLVRVWLPGDCEETKQAIADIRDSVGTVLAKTPWKPSLWRSVVRAAARRPTGPGTCDDSGEDRAARQWLKAQLSRIACEGSEGASPDSWIRAWPEECLNRLHPRENDDMAWRQLYLSYHRAIFWQELAAAIRLLLQHHHRQEHPLPGDPGPPSWRWSVRAAREGRHRQVAEFLSALDLWVAALYPKDISESDNPAGLVERPWELDRLVQAVLAASSRTSIAESARQCARPSEDSLTVPQPLLLRGATRTLALLERCKRIQRRGGSARSLDEGDLARIRLGVRDDRLGRLLFPDGPNREVPIELEPRSRLAHGVALGCASSLNSGLALNVKQCPSRSVQEIRTDPLVLRDYGRRRRLRLGRGGHRPAEPTLHGLLWGAPWAATAAGSWPIRPWDVPAVGLPVRVCLLLYRRAQAEDTPTDWTPARGPLVWGLSREDEVLWAGRESQFGTHGCSRSTVQDSCKPRVVRSVGWEVPPHPAYFLPFASMAEDTDMSRVCGDDYVFYCDVLLLLTALDGGERILDSLVENGAGAVPFEDRWDWRSRIHLPKSAWQIIEKVIRWSEWPANRRCLQDTGPLEVARGALNEILNAWTPRSLQGDEFSGERVDILLETKRDEESVREVRSRGSLVRDLPDALRPKDGDLSDALTVRIGQISAWTNMSEVIQRFPRVSSGDSTHIMEQVARAFQSHDQGNTKPSLVLLPELSIPQPEIRTVRDLAKETGLASLAGLYWKVVRPVYRAHENTCVTRRWIVNEAELVVPLGTGDRGPVSLRWY